MIYSNFKDLLLTQVQVSNLLSISRTSIHTAIKEGKLNLVEKKIGAVVRKFFDWRSIEQLLKVFPNKKQNPPKLRRKYFGNLKGGTGKSTVACQYTMASSACGIRTLHIDLDPQGHSTLALTRKKFPEKTPTILSCIKDNVPLSDVAIEVTPFLDVIPSHLGLTIGEVSLFQDMKRAERLKIFLDSIESKYDQVIFDTSPSAGLLTVNALVAADEIICVTETEFYSVQGLTTFFKLLKTLSSDFEITKNIKIVPNFHSLNSRDSEEAVAFLRTSKSYKSFYY